MPIVFQTNPNQNKLLLTYIAEITSPANATFVEKICQSEMFISDLSFTIKDEEDSICGYTMAIHMDILAGENVKYPSLYIPLLLATHHPSKKAVNSLLLEALIKAAKQLKYTSLLVSGDPDFYSQFGFKDAFIEWEIQAPYEVPNEILMALEISPGSLSCVTGMVNFPELFYTF